MFSGCAPYPVVIAKNTKAKQVIGIELNPIAHKYGIENVRLNKLGNVELFLGDVRKVILSKDFKTFDRIIMPLPRGGEEFLDSALKVAKKGTIIHFYDFLHETEFDKAKDKVAKACKKARKKYKTLNLVKCGQYSSRTYRVCVDFRVL